MKLRTVKCLYCSKIVKVSKKEHVMPHVQSNKVKCVGVGMELHQVLHMHKLIEETRKENENKKDNS